MKRLFLGRPLVEMQIFDIVTVDFCGKILVGVNVSDYFAENLHSVRGNILTYLIKEKSGAGVSGVAEPGTVC